MISHIADPRTPRQSAEAIIRRAKILGDPEMMRRGQEVLRYAEQQEALERSNRLRPHEVYEQSGFEEGGRFIEGARLGGQIVGLMLVAFWFLTIFFSWKVVAVGYVCAGLAGVAGWAGYCTLKRARQ